MSDLSKWKEGAKLLASFPKEARCDEFGWMVVEQKLIGIKVLSTVEAWNNFIPQEHQGNCLRVDDFAELDSIKFLENCGMVIVEKVRNNVCSVDFILDGKFDAGLFGQCETAFPKELNYFLAIVEIAKRAWIENLPEWQEVWFKGFGDHK